MAIGSIRRGRPCYVARINLDTDTKLALIDSFYGACAGFHYQDVVQLSRALGIYPGTINKWKYKMQFPHWSTALAVIEWVKQGKPKDEVSRIQDAPSLLD
jgi:hypothetical protein